MQSLGKIIAERISKSNRRSRFAAVGVSVPGLLDRQEGVLVTSPNMGWSDVPVRALLEAELKLPVHVENDANAAALSELWYGSPDLSGTGSLLFVLVVQGIGTGLILNGDLYVGTRIGLGGFGHMPIDPDGPRCTCGNTGCWEALASDDATLKRFALNSKDREHHPPRRMSELIRLAHNGDAAAIKELLTTASLIGKGIRALAQGLAPDVIVVGGQITGAWNLVENALQAETNSLYLVPGITRPRIRAAGVENPALFGAIPLALNNVIQRQSKLRQA